MRVVVTGKGGQLALEFEDLKNGDVNWTFLDIHLLDITDELSVVKYFQNNPCDLIINCAAYTAVDLAEDNEEMAYKVNQIGVRNLLKVCSSMNAKFIHYSTDYVFDGTKSSPYVETDVPNPRSVYGASKLAGELEIQNSDVRLNDTLMPALLGDVGRYKSELPEIVSLPEISFKDWHLSEQLFFVLVY